MRRISGSSVMTTCRPVWIASTHGPEWLSSWKTSISLEASSELATTSSDRSRLTSRMPEALTPRRSTQSVTSRSSSSTTSKSSTSVSASATKLWATIAACLLVRCPSSGSVIDHPRLLESSPPGDHVRRHVRHQTILGKGRGPQQHQRVLDGGARLLHDHPGGLVHRHPQAHRDGSTRAGLDQGETDQLGDVGRAPVLLVRQPRRLAGVQTHRTQDAAGQDD